MDYRNLKAVTESVKSMKTDVYTGLAENRKTLQILKSNLVTWHVNRSIGLEGFGDVRMAEDFCPANGLQLPETQFRRTPDIMCMSKQDDERFGWIYDVKVSDSLTRKAEDRSAVDYIMLANELTVANGIKFTYTSIAFDGSLTEWDTHLITISSQTGRELVQMTALDDLRAVVALICMKITVIVETAKSMGMNLLEEHYEAEKTYKMEGKLSRSVVREECKKLVGVCLHEESDGVDLVFGEGKFAWMRGDWDEKAEEELRKYSSMMKDRKTETVLKGPKAWIKPELSGNFEAKLDEGITKLGYKINVDNATKRPFMPLPFFDLQKKGGQLVSEYESVMRAIREMRSYVSGELGLLLEAFSASQHTEDAKKLFNGTFDYSGGTAEAVYAKIRKEESMVSKVPIKGSKKIQLPANVVIQGSERPIREPIMIAADIEKKQRFKESLINLSDAERHKRIMERRDIKGSSVMLLSAGGEEVVDRLASWLATPRLGSIEEMHSMKPSDKLSSEPEESVRIRDDARAARNSIEKYFYSCNMSSYLSVLSVIYKELLFMGTQNVENELVVSTGGLEDTLIIMGPGRSLTESNTKRSFKIICKTTYDPKDVMFEVTKDLESATHVSGLTYILETKWLKVTPEHANHYSKILESTYATSVGQLLDLPNEINLVANGEDVLYFFGYVPIMMCANKRQTSAIAQLSRYVMMAATSESAALEQGMLDKLTLPLRNKYEIWLIKRMCKAARDALIGDGIKETVRKIKDLDDNEQLIEKTYRFHTMRTAGTGYSTSLSVFVSDFYLSNVIDKTDGAKFAHTLAIMNDIAKAEWKWRSVAGYGKKEEELTEDELARREITYGYPRNGDFMRMAERQIDMNVEHIGANMKMMNLGAKKAIESVGKQKYSSVLNEKAPFANLASMSNTKSVVRERHEKLPDDVSFEAVADVLAKMRIRKMQEKSANASGEPVEQLKHATLRLGDRSKNMEVVISQLEKMEKTAVIPNLDELAKDWINSTLDPYANFIPKDQIGGSRDIAIQDFPTKVSNAMVEYLSRELCRLHPMEMLTHKGKFDIQKKLASTHKRWSEKIWYHNADNTKWGPHMMPMQFISILQPLRGMFSEDYIDHCCFQLLKMMNKQGEYPEELVKFLTQEFMDTSRLTPEMLMMYKSMKDEKKLCLDMHISMWQGILHYTSSWAHVCRMEVQDEVFNQMYLDAKEKFLRAHQVSSDDRGSVYKVTSTASMSAMDWIKRWNVTDRWIGAMFNMKFNEMKSNLHGKIYEFNSNFMAEGGSSSAPMKFLPTITVMPPTADYDSDVRFMFSTLSQIHSQGMSLCALQMLIDLSRHIINELYRTGEGMWNGLMDDEGKSVPQGKIPVQLGGFPNINPMLIMIGGIDSYNILLESETESMGKGLPTASEAVGKLYASEGDSTGAEDVDPLLDSRRLQPRGIVFKVRQIRQIEVVMERLKLDSTKIRENQAMKPFSLFLTPRTVAAAHQKETNKFLSVGIENAFGIRSINAQRIRIAKSVKKAVCSIKGNDVAETNQEWREKLKEREKLLLDGSLTLETLKAKADEIEKEYHEKRIKMTFREAVMSVLKEAHDEKKMKAAMSLYLLMIRETNPYIHLTLKWLRSIKWRGTEVSTSVPKLYLRGVAGAVDYLSTENDTKMVLAEKWSDAWDTDKKENYKWLWDRASMIDTDWEILKSRIPWIKNTIRETANAMGYKNVELDNKLKLQIVSDTVRAIEKSKDAHRSMYLASSARTFQDTLIDVLKFQYQYGYIARFSTDSMGPQMMLSPHIGSKSATIIPGSNTDNVCKLLAAMSQCENNFIGVDRRASRAACYSRMFLSLEDRDDLSRKSQVDIKTAVATMSDDNEGDLMSAYPSMWRYLQGVKFDLDIRTNSLATRTLTSVTYKFTKAQEMKGKNFNVDADGDVVVQVGMSRVLVQKQNKKHIITANGVDAGSVIMGLRIGVGLLGTTYKSAAELTKTSIPDELKIAAGSRKSGFVFDRDTTFIYKDGLREGDRILDIGFGMLEEINGMKMEMPATTWDSERLVLRSELYEKMYIVMFRSPKVSLSWNTTGVRYPGSVQTLWQKWSSSALQLISNANRQEMFGDRAHMQSMLEAMTVGGDLDLGKKYIEMAQDGMMDVVPKSGLKVELGKAVGITKNDALRMEAKSENRIRSMAQILSSSTSRRLVDIWERVFSSTETEREDILDIVGTVKEYNTFIIAYNACTSSERISLLDGNMVRDYMKENEPEQHFPLDLGRWSSVLMPEVDQEEQQEIILNIDELMSELKIETVDEMMESMAFMSDTWDDVITSEKSSYQTRTRGSGLLSKIVSISYREILRDQGKWLRSKKLSLWDLLHQRVIARIAVESWEDNESTKYWDTLVCMMSETVITMGSVEMNSFFKMSESDKASMRSKDGEKWVRAKVGKESCMKEGWVGEENPEVVEKREVMSDKEMRDLLSEN